MTYSIPEDIYNRLDNTKPVKSNNYDPYIETGTGEFAVVAIEPFHHETHGPSIRTTFLVLSSEKAPVGSRCVQTYNIVKGPKFPGGETDADRFADFVMKLKGAPANHPIGHDIRMLMKSRAEGGRLEEQLARGMRIKCFGKDVYAGKPGHKPFVKPTWFTVAQDPASIAELRGKIEVHLQSNPLPPTGKNQAPQQYAPPAYQAQAQPQYAPPPQAAPQYAPPPQAAPQQWAPQAPAPQSAPAAGPFLSQLTPPGTPTGNGGW